MHPVQLRRCYAVHGLTSASAECLLIIPGLGAGKSMFDMAIPIFEKRFKIIVMSSPGIDDAPTVGAWSVNAMAQTVLEVLATENVSKCHVIGHSMGGMIAQAMHQLHPDIVGDLVLISSSAGGVVMQRHVKNCFDGVLDGGTLKQFYKRIKLDYLQSVASSYSKKFMREEPAFFRSFSRKYLVKKNKTERLSALKHLVASCKVCFTPFLKNINVRTLVLHGDEDHILPYESGLQLAALIPNAQFVQYASCGHFPFVENRTAFATIYTFLADGIDVGTTIKMDAKRDERVDVYISPYAQLISMLKESLNYIISRGRT